MNSVLLLFFVYLALSNSTVPSGEYQLVLVKDVPPDQGTHSAIVNLIARGGAKCYFGVPREADVVPEQLQGSGKIKIEGYHFYARPLPNIQHGSLSGLIVDAFSRFDLHRSRSMAPKMCGGFHPDLAVVSEKEGRKVTLLVCLSCFEWEAHSGSLSYESDIDPLFVDLLRVIHSYSFAEYQKNG